MGIHNESAIEPQQKSYKSKRNDTLSIISAEDSFILKASQGLLLQAIYSNEQNTRRTQRSRRAQLRWFIIKMDMRSCFVFCLFSFWAVFRHNKGRAAYTYFATRPSKSLMKNSRLPSISRNSLPEWKNLYTKHTRFILYIPVRPQLKILRQIYYL